MTTTTTLESSKSTRKKLLRLFPTYKAALNAFNDPDLQPDVVTLFHSRLMWRHVDGSETYFRSVESADSLRGMEWTFISYDEAGEIDGETVAMLEAMKRPESAQPK